MENRLKSKDFSSKDFNRFNIELEILKNYKIVIWYAVTVYNSKIIWLKDKHDLTIKIKVHLCYFNLHRKMKLP